MNQEPGWNQAPGTRNQEPGIRNHGSNFHLRVQCWRQVEGRQPRWELFHHVHMVSRTVKRMPACSSLTAAESVPGAAGWHVLNSHLAWMLGPLLQMFRCLHSLYTPPVSTL